MPNPTLTISGATWNRHRIREREVGSPFLTANSVLLSASDREAQGNSFKWRRMSYARSLPLEWFRSLPLEWFRSLPLEWFRSLPLEWFKSGHHSLYI